MIFETDWLDAAVLQYLQQVERTKGAGFHGVYAWQARSERPGDGWLWFLGAGVAVLIVALVLPRPDFLSPRGARFWQPGLAIVSALLGLLGLRRLLFAKVPLLGDFLFVDALYAWEVAPDRVEVTKLDGLLGVELYAKGIVEGTSLLGHTLYQAEGNLYTLVVLKYATGFQELIVRENEVAERIKTFLDNLMSLQGDVAAEPELLGALAKRLAADDTICASDQWTPGPDLPRI